MRFLLIFVAIVGSTCTVDEPKANGVSADQSATKTCTGNLYDGCTSDEQCDSQLCKLYRNRDVHLCTQTCSATSPCPDQGGHPVICNNMGLCRPDAENACELH